jgi:hypothetical protein
MRYASVHSTAISDAGLLMLLLLLAAVAYIALMVIKVVASVLLFSLVCGLILGAAIAFIIWLLSRRG